MLHVSHAVQILAGITAPLHPLGSAADHLYQIQDAGIEILVFEGERYSARAAELAGAPRVVDGDTLVIGAERIRLEGIDAPETDQACRIEAGCAGPPWSVIHNSR